MKRRASPRPLEVFPEEQVLEIGELHFPDVLTTGVRHVPPTSGAHWFGKQEKEKTGLETCDRAAEWLSRPQTAWALGPHSRQVPWCQRGPGIMQQRPCRRVLQCHFCGEEWALIFKVLGTEGSPKDRICLCGGESCEQQWRKSSFTGFSFRYCVYLCVRTHVYEHMQNSPCVFLCNIWYNKVRFAWGLRVTSLERCLIYLNRWELLALFCMFLC